MRSQNQIVVTALTAGLFFGVVGCGEGFKTSNQSSSSPNTAAAVPGGGGSSTVASQMAQAATASTSAQQAISQAEAAIASVSDSSGNISLNLFSSLTASSFLTQGLLAPVLSKLKPIFDDIYTDAQTVKAQFESAKTALNSALASLDASDPTQAAEIAQINQEILQIAALETDFENEMHALATKLTTAQTSVDNLITQATSSIGGVAGVVVGVAANLLVVDQLNTFIEGYATEFAAL